ncbi:GDSL-type esterase/lipase family protein [Pantoea sp. CTOTU49201]|uniref:GDSL-type esterase/lipase family protein n=1 Tax=Pantoea sp. CTOTU49201 TaxID=2953855 RepID=UPI0028A1805F|nr:GDSL-type esterase/lipase family protein [Pantoea sp. CTOTU49201]
MLKKLMLTSVLFGLSYAASGSDESNEKRSSFYLQTKAQYERFTGRYDIVMFGDSLTERGHWQDMFPDVRIGNRGIGGDDTSGMLARMSEVEATGAKVVFIMAGTNDLSRHVAPDIIAKNIITIAKKFSVKGIYPIIQSTILSGEKRLNKNQKIQQINELLKRSALANGYIYLDINHFIAPDGYLMNKNTLDGTHLTVEGYQVWKEVLNRFIK